jgi:predicted GH43/DUF377 family glycosyl hydrolase/DNA-binding MarR family transcriptional regulator
VIEDGNSFKMWYAGGAQPTIAENIGYANSTDGLNWIKNPGTVLVKGLSGSWEAAGVSAPAVIKDGAIYKMWYGGIEGFSGIDAINARMGYATSADGINWNKYALNPVMDLGSDGSWDAGGVYPGTVLKEGDQYKMWYTGYDFYNLRVGLALSDDGVNWTRHISNPILTLGAASDWDGLHVCHFSVVNVSGVYRGWFGGNDGFNWNIGAAYSSDGINWTKDIRNPVLTWQGTGWESHDNMDPRVIYNGTGYRMWFSGVTNFFNPWVYSFGHADIVRPSPARPVAPANGTLFTNPRPDFAWAFNDTGGSNESSAFRLQLAADSGFGQPVFDSGRIQSAMSSYAPGSDLPEGTYQWRVMVWDGNGISGGWSAKRTIRLDTKPPANPFDTQSSSHSIAVWSSDQTISVNWTIPPAGEAMSGYRGFSISWDTSCSTVPDSVVDLMGLETESPPMPESASVFFHIRAVDNSGNWNATAAHLGPFFIDPSPPGNPLLLRSPSHVPGRWNNDTTVEMTWSGENGELSGIFGYSVIWSERQDTIPPENVSIGALASGYTCPPLADGSGWYFHIRTRDNAGNWNVSMVHSGPYKIDSSPPRNPGDVRSQSHFAGVWSRDRTVDIVWSAADGSISRTAGYSYLWDTRPDTLPPAVINVSGGVLAASSPPLADGGSWYFHIRSSDAAGNWNASAVHCGPFSIDDTPPANPSGLTSTSHRTDETSNDSTVDISWSGADWDISGVGGYSVLWSSDPFAMPPERAGLPGNANAATSPPLPDGDDWYFHIRTFDGAGNWAPDASHLGPFRIDTAVPVPPDLPPVILRLMGPDNMTVNASGELRFSVEAIDPEGRPLAYRWTEHGRTLGDERNLTAVFEPGHHILEVEVADGKNTITGRFDFTVLPDVGPPPPQTIPEGSVDGGLLEGPRFYVAAGTLIVPILLAGALALGGEAYKYRLMLLFLPLFTRLHREELLDHELRGMLRGVILADPGIHYNELVRQIKAGNGTVAYHLSTLEREGIIKSRRDGVLKRFYPGEMRLVTLPVRLNGVQLLILRSIQKQEGLSQRNVAAGLDIPYLTVHRHINKMVKMGVLRLDKKGITTKCYVEGEWQKFEPGQKLQITGPADAVTR